MESLNGIFAFLGSYKSKPQTVKIRNKYFVSDLSGLIVKGAISILDVQFPGLYVLAM